MIDVESITDLHRETVRRWHRRPIDNPYRGFLQFVCREHQANFRLWRQHEILRGVDATDAHLAALTQNADALNRQRNDFIEQLDYYLLTSLGNARIEPRPGARLNSETPGGAIDRLSILSLRIDPVRQRLTDTTADATDCAKAEALLRVLHEQHRDLAACLEELLDDLFAGRKRLKVYRQFKPPGDVLTDPYRFEAEGRPAA